MKQLRAIRILMAVLFFTASAACLTIGPQIHPMAKAARDMQIILSAASVTLGATLVWLPVTFLFGRIYCASVCPVGVLSDIFLSLRRHIPALRKPFRYRSRSRMAGHLVWIYVLCLVAGITAVPFVIEPWNIARNIASAINPKAISGTWITIGLGTAVGIVAGVAALILIALTSLRSGREFCTRICPLGTAMGFIQERSLMHIEIDPDKCISCGRCEENCRSQCIKIVSRYVDNARCVRCFDCVADCPADAIRFQIDKNRRPASPLMRKAQAGKRI